MNRLSGLDGAYFECSGVICGLFGYLIIDLFIYFGPPCVGFCFTLFLINLPPPHQDCHSVDLNLAEDCQVEHPDGHLLSLVFFFKATYEYVDSRLTTPRAHRIPPSLWNQNGLWTLLNRLQIVIFYLIEYVIKFLCL